MKQLTFIISQQFSPYHSAAFELIQQFDPACEVDFADEGTTLNGPASAVIRIHARDDQVHFDYTDDQGKRLQKAYVIQKQPVERETFKRFLYSFLTDIYGYTLPWGSLTGIKPVKIAHAYMKQEGLSESEAAERMRQVYYISEKKSPSGY